MEKGKLSKGLLTFIDVPYVYVENGTEEAFVGLGSSCWVVAVGRDKDEDDN